MCRHGEEYEELLPLYDKDEGFQRWTMWRSQNGIVVQPTMERTLLFDFIADALEALIPSVD